MRFVFIPALAADGARELRSWVTLHAGTLQLEPEEFGHPLGVLNYVSVNALLPETMPERTKATFEM
jgi:hypothetical protein